VSNFQPLVDAIVIVGSLVAIGTLLMMLFQ